MAGSLVIDRGDPAFAPPPATDQRGTGFARVVNSRIDMGAVEVQTTGAGGGYRFTGLPTGSNQVRFGEPPGFVFTAPLQGTKRGKDSNADPGTGLSSCLTMPAGKVRRGIDAGLFRQAGGSGRIGDRVWHDQDGDGIQDAGEPGLADVSVRLRDCDGNVWSTTTTGASGAYVSPDWSRAVTKRNSSNRTDST